MSWIFIIMIKILTQSVASSVGVTLVDDDSEKLCHKHYTLKTRLQNEKCKLILGWGKYFYWLRVFNYHSFPDLIWSNKILLIWLRNFVSRSSCQILFDKTIFYNFYIIFSLSREILLIFLLLLILQDLRDTFLMIFIILSRWKEGNNKTKFYYQR